MDIYHPWFDVFNYSEDRLLRILGRVEYISWLSYRSSNEKIRKIDEVYRHDWNEEDEEIQHISDLFENEQSYIDSYGFPVKVEELIEYMKKAEKECLWKDRIESLHDLVARFQTVDQYMKQKNFKY